MKFEIPNFHRGTLAFALVLLAHAACLPASGGEGAGEAVAAETTVAASDRRVLPEPPLPPLPRAGGKFKDPTFGTEIMRVTDERDGQSNGTYYVYWPTFNRDNTRLLVRRAQEGDAIYEFDPDNFRLGGKYAVPRLPGNGTLITEGAAWSSSDRNILYGTTFDGARLWALDAAKRAYRLVKDFSREPGFKPGDYLWQMSKSADDDMFAFTRRSREYKSVGYVVWRRSADKLLVNTASALEDEVGIDKTGRFLLIPLTEADAEGKDFFIRDLQTGRMTGLTRGGPDYSPAHGDTGTGVLIAWDNDENRLLKRSLATPHSFSTVLDLKPDWSQHLHLSLLADNEEWALIGFYSGAGIGAGLFHRELILLKTDGSGQVRRVLHHRSIYRDYWDSPRANMSRDGRFIAFTSNWGGQPRQDLFIARLDPPLPPPGARIPTATPAQTETPRAVQRPRRVNP